MNNFYHKAHFIQSATSIKDSPPDEGREVAFAGRSNAGKSSALNTISQQKALARTSKTPGRTQLINYFALTDELRLVDLPGYGYAKVPQAMKLRWQRDMAEYLQERQALCGVVLVMDVRHPLTDYDQQMLAWCYEAQLPVHILLTKSDKLKRGPAMSSLHRVEQHIREHLGGQTTVQLFSATKRIGVDEVHAQLDRWLEPQS